MIKHPSLVQWEKKLKAVLDALDDLLEEKYGEQFRLHPARPDRGKTSNKAHDGLFDIVASFSMGTGSEHGKGYVVDVHMATLDHVPQNVKAEIEGVSLQYLRKELPGYFPGKNLQISKDGHVIKIHGDLSLGEL